jgi:hypothetical protein
MKEGVSVSISEGIHAGFPEITDGLTAEANTKSRDRSERECVRTMYGEKR